MPKTPTKPVLVQARIDPEIFRRLRKAADADHRSIAAYLRLLIEREMRKP